MYIKQTAALPANPLVKRKENRAISGREEAVPPETVAKPPHSVPVEGGLSRGSGTGLGTETFWPLGPQDRAWGCPVSLGAPSTSLRPRHTRHLPLPCQDVPLEL